MGKKEDDMYDIDDLISMILADEKLVQQKSPRHEFYEDEPILCTGTALANRPQNKFRKMRDIAHSYDAYRNSLEWLFFQQGKFMADFTDCFEFHEQLIRYFPTYNGLTDRQLRGYFSWRTKVRSGTIEPTATAFVFLYLYELLNQIGTKSPEDGFQQLKTFGDAYRQLDDSVRLYLDIWQNDYIIYYRLDTAKLENTAELLFDNALLVLLHPDKHSAKAVFDAMLQLSSYHMERSKFYKDYPDDVCQVTYLVFFALSDFYQKNRKHDLCTHLFGRKINCAYQMFRSAVFFEQMSYRSFDYVLNEIHQYHCKDGLWMCEKYYGSRSENKTLGTILKAIDFLMRKKYDYAYQLKQNDAPKYVSTMIQKELDQFYETKQKEIAAKAIQKVEFDLSKLQNIRLAAEITREKLLVEPEESEALQMPAEAPASTEPEGIAETKPLDTFSDTELQFLRCLLYEKTFSAQGVMPSVLADAVNEKLFAQFEDTVIQFDGDTPELIADYINELKGMVAP